MSMAWGHFFFCSIFDSFFFRRFVLSCLTFCTRGSCRFFRYSLRIIKWLFFSASFLSLLNAARGISSLCLLVLSWAPLPKQACLCCFRWPFWGEQGKAGRQRVKSFASWFSLKSVDHVCSTYHDPFLVTLWIDGSGTIRTDPLTQDGDGRGRSP